MKKVLQFAAVALIIAGCGCGMSPQDRLTVNDKKINGIIAQMTLEEKVEMLHSKTNMSSEGVPRLGIQDIKYTDGPFGIREENGDGFRSLGWTLDSATYFPTGSALAATWSKEMARKNGWAMGKEGRLRGKDIILGPAINIQRLPVGGRTYEYLSEDPVLAARLSVEYTIGSQEAGTAVCLKHYALNNQETDRGSVNVIADERTMREIYLKPFEAAIKEGGAMCVMPAYNKVNGYYCSENAHLNNEILRGEWGFKGFVVSDWASIHEMVNHGYAEDNKHAGELAFNAGVDMDMMSFSYISHLEELINEGKVSMETVDKAVRSILRVKFRLGLFENPYIDEPNVEAAFYSEEALEAARKSAVESAVLLTNDGVLPLNRSKVKTVLVTGPMADALHDQLGTWTFDGDPAHTVTPLAAIRELYGEDVNVIYEPGLTYSREFDKGGIAKAVKAAKKADVILAFMGEEAILSGEAHSLVDITLKGDQRQLLEALYETGKPVVLNIMAGRSLVLDFEIEHSDAILYSFHPGTMGGPAIAQLIFGDETPSGKTPITFPKNVGQIPIYYNHNMTGRPYNGTETMLYDIPLRAGQTSLGNTSYWLDSTFEPEFPFGYGLTYTTFEYSAPEIEMTEYTENDTIRACVTIKNTGDKAATEVVQLYVRDLVGSVTRPVKELKRFHRVTVAPGQTMTVGFELPVQDLAFYGKDMVKKVEPGKFQLWIAGDSASGTPVEFEVK